MFSIFKSDVLNAVFHTDNVLKISLKENVLEVKLKEYRFDINKPVKAGENHLLKDEFISRIKEFINETIGFRAKFWLILDLNIATHKRDAESVQHFLDLGEMLGCKRVWVYALPDGRKSSALGELELLASR